MKKTVLFTVFILSLMILAIGCAPQEPQAPSPSPVQVVVEEKPLTVEGELSKITQGALEKTLTEKDFEGIESLLKDDTAKLQEIEGVKALARHQEYGHVLHVMGLVQKFIETGEHSLCPAHDLGHYYIYVENGETEVANNILARVKHQFSRWQVIAEDYLKDNPGTLPNYEGAKSMTAAKLAAIEGGDSTATHDEIGFLTNEGAICFDDDGSVKEHDHEGHGDEHMDHDKEEHEGHMEKEESHGHGHG